MHNDEKIIKITRCVRSIENKKKLINSRMINEYVKNQFNPKDIIEKDLGIEQIKTKLNTSFNAKELYLKENSVEIICAHEYFIDVLLSYDHRVKNTKKTKTKKLFIIGAITLVLIAISIIMYSSKTEEISEEVIQKRIRDAKKSYTKKLEQKQKGNVDGAWVYMKMFVEQRLKSPKSADFPFGGATYYTTDLGGGRYRVNSYVDAENAFGANIRTRFNGVIKRKDGGWVLESLNFEN